MNTDTPVLDALEDAKEAGATGAVVTPDIVRQLEAEIASLIVPGRPNRATRRAMGKPRTPDQVSPTAAARRRTRRQIEQRSRARNRR